MNKTSCDDQVAMQTSMAECHLYLFNDDIHSFEYVFRALMEVLDKTHSLVQIEQIIMIAHNNGKAHVKMGSWDDLYPMQQKLDAKELIVELRKDLYNA